MNVANAVNAGLVELTVRGARPVVSREEASGRRLSRREAMGWVMGAVAASAMPGATGAAAAQEVGRTVAPQQPAAAVPPRGPGTGYGTDPDLARYYKPGDVWPLTFTEEQRAAAAALADTILPADDLGPAASEVGVIEMLDEWVSAPYPVQLADRPVVLDGLAWIDAESARRFGQPFAALPDEHRRAICDDLCTTATRNPAYQAPAAFFARFRALCAGAYYATPAGWKALGYVGNVALERFDGPPQEVLDRLGVTQTVA